MIRPKCWHALGRGAGPELVIYPAPLMSATHDQMAFMDRLTFSPPAGHGNGCVAECSREKH